MSIMDLFLLTSFGEGLPNVLLEAQWAGTPVVATDVGGAKEAIEPGVTGWVIDTNEPQDLAGRVKWLHDNPAVLQAARIKGPQWVRQQFGITRMVEETIRVYDLHVNHVPQAHMSVHASARVATGPITGPNLPDAKSFLLL